MGFRIGVDTGGTFTDLVLLDESDGNIQLIKLSSSPTDPSIAFAAAVERVLQDHQIPPQEIRYLVHGTTVATNAIIEGTGARTALLTTEGFRDVLEIARQIRPELYNLFTDKPKPLVPRRFCRGIPERLDFKGEVLTPLDEDAVRSVVRDLIGEQIESLAVCLLHAYQNPRHERRIREIIHDVAAAENVSLAVSLSSDLCPEMREYYRTSTTVVNALLVPVISGYIERIRDRMVMQSVSTKLHLMTSSGGMITANEACIAPVQLIESGPAAGVTGAARLGTNAGFPNVISFDMGGTTAKVGLVEDGKPRVAAHFEVGSAAVVADRAAGYPVRTPVIDLVEIGAGGGSIASIDPGGALRVGPSSAGADPGPACYGNGQEFPTVTDANLVLGRLDPDYFVGGEMKLDKSLAEAAIDRIARQLRLDRLQAAHGIVEIANAHMGAAIQLVSVQRGFDPREFTLVAFGGAGPLHAIALAAEAQIPTTVIPPNPGVASAWGLLVSDLRFDLVQPFLAPLSRLTESGFASMRTECDAIVEKAHQQLARENVAQVDQSIELSLEMRYVGQSFELNVHLRKWPLQSTDVNELANWFHEAHAKAYGHATHSAEVEIVSLRATATGVIPHPQTKEIATATESAKSAIRQHRPVYFAKIGGIVECPVYDRYRLFHGHVLDGPAIIDEFDSTTVIEPGFQVTVDRLGNLIVHKNAFDQQTP